MSSSHNVPRQEAELGAGHYSRCVTRAGPTALREAAVHCQLGAGRYIYISTYLLISTHLLYLHRYVIVCHAHTGAGQARARGEFYLRCVVGCGPGQGSQLRALQQEETHL